MSFNNVCFYQFDILPYFSSRKRKLYFINISSSDYKSLQYYHPVLDVKYYIESLQLILKKEQDKTMDANAETTFPLTSISSQKWLILYFCEDEDIVYVETKIKIIREECAKMYKHISIEFERASSNEEDNKLCDWKELLLMSCCHHNIIANSSFSWWAGYFNDNPDKEVCYPEKWFGPKLANNDIRDLCPSSWNKIIF